MMAHSLRAGLEEIRHNWVWFLALGILLIVLGVIAAIAQPLFTLATVVFFGWLLLISGVAQCVQAVWEHGWRGFFLHVLAGILEVVVGLLMVTHPGAAAATLTLLLVAYLMVGGLFRMIAAFSIGFPGSGWVALGGLVSFLLGLVVGADWPESAIWLIGLCVGIDLMFHGAAWVAFALAARRLPQLPSRIDPSVMEPSAPHHAVGGPGGI
jgi:uncharacterized membrane protein HdeD (DUF308 family)